ncbi:MAG: hypothetical protein AAFS10_22060, partial [Myxococcota bacterium]
MAVYSLRGVGRLWVWVLVVVAAMWPVGWVHAQEDMCEPGEKLSEEGQDDQTRMVIAGAAVGGVYAAVGTWAYFAW